jgi:hypothetical protein
VSDQCRGLCDDIPKERHDVVGILAEPVFPWNTTGIAVPPQIRCEYVITDCELREYGLPVLTPSAESVKEYHRRTVIGAGIIGQ